MWTEGNRIDREGNKRHQIKDPIYKHKQDISLYQPGEGINCCSRD